jgi:hypothetical protein
MKKPSSATLLDKNSSLSKQNREIRIGFDFDNVFVNNPPFIPDFVIDWIYKKKSKTLKYRMPGELEQKIRILSHFPIFRHPIKYNIDALKELHKSNYSLYLLSGRLGFLDKRTEHWLKKYPITKYFQEIYFNLKNDQAHYFKDYYIKSLRITHFIDDDLDLLLYLAKENPNVSFFWINTSRFLKRYIPFDNIKEIKKISDITNL